MHEGLISMQLYHLINLFFPEYSYKLLILDKYNFSLELKNSYYAKNNWINLTSTIFNTKFK